MSRMGQSAVEFASKKDSPPPSRIVSSHNPQRITMASTASTAAAESTTTNNNNDNVHEIAIVGGGIVGLVLALALHKIGIVSVEIYEREPAFHADVGAGQGMYSNGLRVIRDLSPELLEKVREAGFPYQYRRWERHDGTEVAVANETVLSDKDDEHIQSIGIRRWRLLNVLYEAVVEAGIPVHFGKKLVGVNSDENGVVQVSFEGGTFMNTQVLFAADGSKSTVRSIIQPSSELKYTGVTCVMGMAENSKPEDVGILFPSSVTSNCHGCFFPTSEEEQCFQMHFPLSESDADEGNWGTLSETVGISECLRLSQAMKEDGWHEKYTSPLLQVTHAVKIGFCSLDPPLSTWVSGKIVLLGDAAHPREYRVLCLIMCCVALSYMYLISYSHSSFALTAFYFFFSCSIYRSRCTTRIGRCWYDCHVAGKVLFFPRRNTQFGKF